MEKWNYLQTRTTKKKNSINSTCICEMKKKKNKLIMNFIIFYGKLLTDGPMDRCLLDRITYRRESIRHKHFKWPTSFFFVSLIDWIDCEIEKRKWDPRINAICLVLIVNWLNKWCMSHWLHTKNAPLTHEHATRTTNKGKKLRSNIGTNWITFKKSLTCMRREAHTTVQHIHKNGLMYWIQLESRQRQRHRLRQWASVSVCGELIGIPLTVDFHLNWIGIQSVTCFNVERVRRSQRPVSIPNTVWIIATQSPNARHFVMMNSGIF